MSLHTQQTQQGTSQAWTQAAIKILRYLKIQFLFNNKQFPLQKKLANAVLEYEEQKVSQYIWINLTQVIDTTPCII
jgi:hypothetical protein